MLVEIIHIEYRQEKESVEAGAVKVIQSRGEDLGLALQTPKRGTVNDAIPIPFKGRPVSVRRFRVFPASTLLCCDCITG